MTSLASQLQIDSWNADEIVVKAPEAVSELRMDRGLSMTMVTISDHCFSLLKLCDVIVPWYHLQEPSSSLDVVVDDKCVIQLDIHR